MLSSLRGRTKVPAFGAKRCIPGAVGVAASARLPTLTLFGTGSCLPPVTAVVGESTLIFDQHLHGTDTPTDTAGITASRNVNMRRLPPMRQVNRSAPQRETVVSATAERLSTRRIAHWLSC